jgi:N,N-dimethylformamidase
MVFFETVGGGAVFTPGSIDWVASLSHNEYQNNVSKITENVVRRFLDW